MWTGRYWLIKVDTMVSSDLLGIREASGQPISVWKKALMSLFSVIKSRSISVCDR